MNRIVVFSCLFLLNINGFAFGDTNYLKRMILENVFSVKEVITVKESDKNIEVFLTELRGKFASIPLNSCFLVQMSDELAVMAFEIYLSENKYDYRNMRDTLKYLDFPENFEYYAKVNKNKSKLIQLIYFDIKNKKFIAKPEGFPLEENFWMPEGYGDVGSPVLNLKSLEKISGSKLGCQLVFTYYVSDDINLKLILVRLKDSSNGQEIIKSKYLKMGSFGSLSGCPEFIDYKNVREEKFSILAELHTECQCEEGCGDIKVGKHTKTVELLKWCNI